VALPGDATMRDDDGDHLEAAIAALTRVTSCEIRVHLAPRGDASTARAIATFEALGVDKTASHSGVLLYVALEVRRLVVVADEGIGDVVPRRAIERAMQMPEGPWVDALARGAERLSRLLAPTFPPARDVTGALSTEVTVDGGDGRG